MAIATWSDPSIESANIAGTALNSLANGSLSAILADVSNGTEKAFNLRFWVVLGSLTPTAGANIIVRLVPKRGSTYMDRTAIIFTGEQQAIAVTTSTGVKNLSGVLRLESPFTHGIEVVNNTGTTTASSGNEFYYSLYNEEIN